MHKTDYKILQWFNDIRKGFQRYLVAGLLVWIPLIVTAWVVWKFIGTVGLGAEGLIQRAFELLNALGARTQRLTFLQEVRYVRGLGLVITVVLLLGTGVLTRYIIGMKIIAAGERLLNRIPLVRPIYRAVQQIRDVFIGRRGAVFQHVCLIDYPREGMTAVAFVTAKDEGPVQHAEGKELVAVFVPTTPNPTSGYLVYLPPEEIRILDISVEDAMKLIVSAGAYIPGVHGPASGKNLAQGAPPAPRRSSGLNPPQT